MYVTMLTMSVLTSEVESNKVQIPCQWSFCTWVDFSSICTLLEHLCFWWLLFLPPAFYHKYLFFLLLTISKQACCFNDLRGSVDNFFYFVWWHAALTTSRRISAQKPTIEKTFPWFFHRCISRTTGSTWRKQLKICRHVTDKKGILFSREGTSSDCDIVADRKI